MKKAISFILLSYAMAANSETSKVVAVISVKTEPNRTVYAISIVNQDPDQTIYRVDYGESCRLGMMIDHQRFNFNSIPIDENNRDYKPKVRKSDDFFDVNTDNYLKLSSIQARSGNPKIPFVAEKSTRTIEFFTTNRNDKLMLNLPICMSVGGGRRDTIDLIVSQEDWVDSDMSFDVEVSTKDCSSMHPSADVDPNKGDTGADCSEAKFQYLAAVPAVQYSCVLEKRLENRRMNLTRNRSLPPKPQEKYNQRLEVLRDHLSKAIEDQKSEVLKMKAKMDHAFGQIAKMCKS